MPFDSAPRPSFVSRLRLSPQLGRIFFKKQTSNQLDAQLVIAICDLYQIVMGNMLTPADYGTVNTMGGGLLLVQAANLIYIALTPEKEKATV